MDEPPASDLTFEEFRAFQQRGRSRQDEKEGKTSTTDKDAKKPAAAAEKEATKIEKEKGGSLGDFLEMPQFQTFVVIMLMLDTFSALAQLLLGNLIAASESGQSGESISDGTIIPVFLGIFTWQIFSDALITFSGFALVFFAFEIGAVLMAFRTRVSGHWGYLMDAVIVSSQLYGELTTDWGVANRLLNLLRMWRLVRLVSYVVGLERAEHDATKLVLETTQTHLGQAKSDNLRGKQELAREQEARVTVDEMLAGYKEEVDTLNEALKIAAMDIAEVAEADEDLLSDEDDELGLGEEEEEDLASVVDDEGFAEAYQGRYDKQKNQADMMAQIGRDRDRDGGGSVRSGASRASSKSQPVTFVIGEDGSFKKK